MLPDAVHVAQYKKKTPLLRLYKTLVGRTSTWVIGAEDEALYYTHSDAVDPPVSGWQAASQAAQPPPSIHLVWSEEGQSGGTCTLCPRPLMCWRRAKPEADPHRLCHDP